MGVPLSHALWITAIGMGLVFAAILVLWGIMEALVRLIPPKKEADETAEGEAESAYVAVVPEVKMCKQRAAALAVSAALALNKASLSVGGKPQAWAAPSSWQVAQRAGQVAQRNPLISRRNRGNVP